MFISELRLQRDRGDCRGKHAWNNQPSVIVWQLLLHQLWVVVFFFSFSFLPLHFTTLTSVRRRLQKWVAMRCRDLFILSWKYKDKQSNTSKEKDGAGGVIADRTPGHTRPKKNPSASLLQHLESRCVYFVCDPLCLVSCSLRACVCVGQEGRKRECERARPVVHVRHCFKRSSYWNGKEWRRAGGEEQATWGGERKRARERAEGPLASKKSFCYLRHRRGGINLSQGLRAAISRQQPHHPPLLFCCLFT